MQFKRIDMKTVGIFLLAASFFFLGGVILSISIGKNKEEEKKETFGEICKEYVCFLFRQEFYPAISQTSYKEGPQKFDESLLDELCFEEESDELSFHQFIKTDGSSFHHFIWSDEKMNEKMNEKTVESESNSDLSPEAGSESYLYELEKENEKMVLIIENDDFLIAGCGFVSDLSHVLRPNCFVARKEKQKTFTKEQLENESFVRKKFYTIDKRTELSKDFYSQEDILSYEVKVDKESSGPQILIYHTHSQEAFADSTPGKRSDTIVGVGDHLSEILEKRYGYEVIHHTAEFDVPERDTAYSKSAPAIEQILSEYPQIQVIIDLHRDGVDENTHLVSEIDGIKYAEFMFFNGACYLEPNGVIERLPNKCLTGNLASSFRATVLGMEYYPELTRKNYINAYRYNMQYRDKSFLIELGAQNNTVEEVMNACEPLAHVLDMVFTGCEI